MTEPTEHNRHNACARAQLADQDPLKEAQPIADAGSLNIEASQATRRSAADGGESAREAEAQAANGSQTDAGRDSVSPELTAQLAPEEADRFAMAFRPSWEPIAPAPESTPSIRFRSFAPSLAPVVPHVSNDAGGFLQDDLLRLRAARVRWRSLALAGVSILSFGALMYWGISNTTDGAENAAGRGLQPPPAAVEPTEAAEPVAPAAPALAAEPTRLSARLADPNAPPAPPAAEAAAREANVQNGDVPNGATTEAKPTEAAQPNATATAEPSAAPAAAEPKPTAASPDGDAKPPTTVTDVKPATAAVEVKPAATAVAVKPVAATKPDSPVAAFAAPAKPPTEGTAPPPAATSPASAIKTPPPTETAETAEAAKAHPPLLVVSALPDSAQLFLDGQRMSNPFDTRLPLGSKHKIDARQDGYETSSQSIRLESDAKLTITLKRATPAPEPHLKVRPMPESANGAGFVTSNPY